jgi:hypothetical protein
LGTEGQQFEVRFINDLNAEAVLGWSKTMAGAVDLARVVSLHPTWHSPKIRDRQNQRWVPKKELVRLLEQSA